MLDIIIILLLLFGAFRGFIKGFVLEIIGIIALIAAVWSGVELMDWGVDILSPYMKGYSGMLPVLSFFFIFFIVLIVINLVGRLVKGALNLVMLGPLDHMAGAIVGCFKWAFSLSLLFWLAESINITMLGDMAEHSNLYSKISVVAPKTFNFLINNYANVESFVNSFQEIFKD